MMPTEIRDKLASELDKRLVGVSATFNNDRDAIVKVVLEKMLPYPHRVELSNDEHGGRIEGVYMMDGSWDPKVMASAIEVIEQVLQASKIGCNMKVSKVKLSRRSSWWFPPRAGYIEFDVHYPINPREDWFDAQH